METMRTGGAAEELATAWYGSPRPPRARATARPAAGAPAPLRAGTVIAGRYRLEEILGAGGFATVYSAYDWLLKRWVAVKVYSSAGGGAIHADEARLQATCQHPNLMPLFDAGTDPLLEAAFIVMPLYPGADLADTLDRFGPMPFKTALLCVDQVCSALEFLRQRRTAHHDVKPGNIWLTRSGAALLLDFNLHGLLVRGASGRLGTPGYTAAEALDGCPDSRSDVFSLGCVLYECLAGTRAFADDAAVRLGKFTPLSRLRADLRPELETVIHRALARNPERRFQSPRELQTALRYPAWACEGLWGIPWRPALRRALRGLAWAGALGWDLSCRAYHFVRREPLKALAQGAGACLLGRVMLEAALGWIQAHSAGITAFTAGALAMAGLIYGRRWQEQRRRRAR